MKKLLFLFLFILLTNQVFAEEYEFIETPSVIIEAIPMDEEHIQVFDTVILQFLEDEWFENKEFPDGDSFVQKLKGVKLIRIDALPNNIDRYVTFLTFEVRRYSKEYAQYTEEFLLQPLYLDVDKNTKRLFRWTAFETIDLNLFLKKEV